MSNPNTPGSLDTVEKNQKSIVPNVQGLLKEGITRELWNPINPEKYDAYKKRHDVMNGNIRANMKSIRRERIEDWSDVTDDMIDGDIKDKEISERIAYMGKSLMLMRKRSFDRALETFPNIKNQGNWESILRNELASYNENELKNYVTRTSSMRKLVYGIFPDLKWENPSEIRDFEKIFHDRDQFLDEPGKQKFLRMYQDYVKFGQVPDGDDMDFILSAYHGASKDRKKEVLTALGVTLTIKSAFASWLVNEQFLRTLAENSMEDIYSGMTDTQKDYFIRGLAQDETYVISASDFDAGELDKILSDSKKRKQLARDVFRSLSLDVPESVAQEADILWDIRKKKQQEAEAKWVEEDYDLYDAFVEEMEHRLQWKVKNIKLLRTPGCVIRFHDENNGIQQVRVKKVRNLDGSPLEVENGMKHGIELEWLATVDGVIRETQNFSLSYDQFQQFLEQSEETNILKAEEFENLLAGKMEDAGKDGKIFDARTIDQDPANANNIAAKLDLIDSEGRGFGFEVGTSFIAPSEEEWTGKKSSEDIWTVKKISGDTVDLMDSGGMSLVKWFPLSEFFNFVASTGTFKRIARIRDDAEMVKELHEFGLDHHAKLKDGKLIVEEHDSHGDDHGHGHATEKEITCFESKDGGHIRMEYIQDGRVRFGEYSSDTDAKKAREIAEKQGIKPKELAGLYTWRTMSYPAFLKYLEKNKLSATTKDLIVPNTAHDLHGGHGDHHHHAHAHMEGSFLKRVMKWQNPASIWKGFEMIMHSIEHTLEKGAKLDASRFAMQTSRFLGLPDSVTAQVYSDVVNESKEIIEKYENKIFGLPGPAWRWKCIHIVHNKDSRAEEVMSAINYMLKSYGHLYSEDIKHYQSVVNSHNIATADPGYFAFLDGLILTTHLPWGLSVWRQKAYVKAKSEMGSDEAGYEGEPTEEQLIHALLKSVDGNWDDYPYAASVVKASGGPSGFEKNWKFEGFDNAYKKGKDQTQMVNAQGRLNKAVGYFNTHEIYKAIGSMEMVSAKVKEPHFQAMPFIWAVWGYSQHASHTALQKLKVYAEQGMSFHAYAFLRNKERNDIYRETVRLALKELIAQGKIDSGALDEFNKTCTRLENGPEDSEITDSKYKKVPPAKAMMDFWQKYQGKWLHDMLQWQNGWLAKMEREGNSTVKTYRETIYGAHGMALKDNSIPSMEFGMDWFKEHGYANIILAKWESGLNSISSMLNKIQFEGTSPGAKPMNEEHREKIWKYVKGYMTGALRDEKWFLWDTKLQKEQYLFHRRELLQYLSEKLTTHGIKDREKDPKAIIEGNIATFPYYKDLADMGIDPHALFYKNLETENAEADYQRWKSGSTVSTSINRVKSIPNLKDMISGRVHKVWDEKPSANDSLLEEAA